MNQLDVKLTPSMKKVQQLLQWWAESQGVFTSGMTLKPYSAFKEKNKL